MQRSRIVFAGIGLVAVAAAGGVTAATVGSSPAGGTAPAAMSAPAASAATGTVRTAQTMVNGRTETILVNAQGQPLYYFRSDTATRSLVSGTLASIWPPLTAGAPTAAGQGGRLTVVSDAHGQQVAYNGHLLYTFTSDPPGQVTGQGVDNFFVATPGLARAAHTPMSAATMPQVPSGGLGY